MTSSSLVPRAWRRGIGARGQNQHDLVFADIAELFAGPLLEHVARGGAIKPQLLDLGGQASVVVFEAFDIGGDGALFGAKPLKAGEAARREGGGGRDDGDDTTRDR